MKGITGAVLASALLGALSAVAPDSSFAQGAQAPKENQPKETREAQRRKDLEHEMVQSDGASHPREVVTPAKSPKAVSKPGQPRAKTQRELDLEHEMLQTDGGNHPREKAGDKAKRAPQKNGSAPPRKTQRELDLEHEIVQSDGVKHPREIIKK
jgi:hypothetical protein